MIKFVSFLFNFEDFSFLNIIICFGIYCLDYLNVEFRRIQNILPINFRKKSAFFLKKLKRKELYTEQKFK